MMKCIALSINLAGATHPPITIWKPWADRLQLKVPGSLAVVAAANASFLRYLAIGHRCEMDPENEDPVA